MAKLNVENFSEDYRDIAPKECAMFLIECLPEDKQKVLKEAWEVAGGRDTIPWWKWCMEHINVSLSLDAINETDTVDGHTKHLQGIDLPIMVNSIQENNGYVPSKVSEMHIGEVNGIKTLLITPEIIALKD